MLDKDKVRNFWNARAKSLNNVAFESIVNLEQDSKSLEVKISHETDKVFSWLGDVENKSILDLGAGVGQWAFRFIDRGAKKVTAVEFSEELVAIGRDEASRRGVNQIEFVVKPAELFETYETFDVVYCSGLCVYLNDDQFELLTKKLSKFVRPNGILVLREGMAILSRYEINDRYSEHLQTNYSATYRTRDEYISALNDSFDLIKDENMFPEGHPLNKYPETRLHLFLFNRET